MSPTPVRATATKSCSSTPRRPPPRIPREIRALCGFARVHLKPGEKKSVAIAVPAVALRRWNVAQKAYAISSGEWTIAAGASSSDLRQTTRVEL